MLVDRRLPINLRCAPPPCAQSCVNLLNVGCNRVRFGLFAGVVFHPPSGSESNEGPYGKLSSNVLRGTARRTASPRFDDLLELDGLHDRLVDAVDASHHQSGVL